ncbi:hypothetical protein HL666_11615 [Bradyrhizobium sp. 83002]|uniref:hypothetical protein n=1 Tax=Bradyrhizobium aeschynomenes TaxID=2734909 RepID=UPI001551997D|nr:hypothetical protein [Bradyrhizobium aeschynomenes]NPU11408.1 hypothetical protein [Bradyrhizobium aeschynomenes]
MTVVLNQSGAIQLIGACSVDDAEPLLQLLLANPIAPIDWRNCDTAHAAVIQVLLAAMRPLRGPPAGTLLKGLKGPAFGPFDRGNASPAAPKMQQPIGAFGSECRAVPEKACLTRS